MAATSIAIANLALTEIGENTTAAITDSNKRAEACNLIYTEIRDSLLERFAWRFAIERKYYNDEVDNLGGREVDQDDFSESSLNARWTETDGGTNIAQTNGRIEGKGSGAAWDINGIISGAAYPLNKNLSAEFTFEAPTALVQAQFGFTASSSLDNNNANQCEVYFLETGLISVMVNGSEVTTTYTYLAGRKYRVQILFTDPGWEVYVTSEEDDDYDDPVRIINVSTVTTGPVYFQMQFYTAITCYFDNWFVKSPYVPAFEYGHRYILPDDCMRVLELFDSTAKYTVEGNYIYTSENEIQVKYIKRVTDVTQFPPIFVDCMVKSMASRLSVRLREDEPMSDKFYELLETVVLPKAFKLDAIERNPKQTASQRQDTSWQREGR